MTGDEGRQSTGPLTATPPLRVLVVDDDPIVRRVTVAMLTAAGLSTQSAASGHEGATQLERHRFDVVVSDVEMPDGSGLDLLRTIRRVDLDIPVILVTGMPAVGSAAKAVEYGAFRYVTKPVDYARLVADVHEAARAHALSRLRREALAATGHGERVVADRAGLEVRFSNALDQMWPAYQPIVTRSRDLYGVEALLRTDEPTMPNPAAVLDAAERLGRLNDVGRRMRRLAGEGIASGPSGMCLFVNLHPDDLFDEELTSAETPLAQLAARVVLEITERASLPSTNALRDRLARLRDLGFRFAIDDIGAGYSGLTSFTEVVPEVVKLDMALVRGVQGSQIRSRTIRSLCELCRDCGSLVVAEGVETVEEHECLLDLHCDLFQGYYLGRPAPHVPGSAELAQ